MIIELVICIVLAYCASVSFYWGQKWRSCYLVGGAADKEESDLSGAWYLYSFFLGASIVAFIVYGAADTWYYFSVCYLIATGYVGYRYYKLRDLNERRARRASQAANKRPEPVPNLQKHVFDTIGKLNIPIMFQEDVEKILYDFPPKEEYEIDVYARYINDYFGYLPDKELLTRRKRTVEIQSLIPLGVDESRDRTIMFAPERLGQDVFTAMSKLGAGIRIPEKIRTQHHQIVGGSGQGKTTLLKSMILDDVEAGHSVIVIDSQNGMINELAPKIPPERLILVDPTHCPPGLNLFQSGTSSELFEYIFASQKVDMTGKQLSYYAFLCQLVTAAGGGMTLMRDFLEPGDKWREYSHLLRENSLAFFETEFSGKRQDTREEIRRRIFGLLANEKLETMIGADDNTIDIKAAVNGGAVILVSTDKDGIGQAGSSLLGRIFIAQIMKEVMSRGPGGKRTYLYVDELQDYAEDSHVLFNLFEQSRKYELGMIVAHQSLGRISSELLSTISSNTAIKFAGGVSAEDARKLASQMNMPADTIFNQPVGSFAAWFKGYGTLTYTADLARSENAPELARLSAIRDRMRREYGAKKRPDKGPDGGQPVAPQGPKGPKLGGVTRDVPESGEW